MNSTALIRQYLRKRSESEDDLGRFPFVTIGRQAGAGSREVADEIVRQVHGKLDATAGTGWEVFDQKLCEFIGDDTKASSALDALMTENYRSETSQFIGDMISGVSRQYASYKKIFEIVRSLALLGKVVLIGRGGAHVCKNMPLGVHIRLVASEETRVKKMAKLMGMDEKSALAKVRELEKGRARMAKTFFDRDINDPLCYHAVFNVDAGTPPEIAALIVEMLQQRMRRFNA